MKTTKELPEATTKEIAGGRLFVIQHENCKDAEQRKTERKLPAMFPMRGKSLIGQRITCSCGCQLKVTHHITYNASL